MEMSGRKLLFGLAAVGAALAAPGNHAQAQGASPAGQASLEAEVARLRAELEAIKAEMRSIRGAAPAPGTPAVGAAAVLPATPGAAAPPGVTAPDNATAAAKPSKEAVDISWKGAPEFKSASGWSFKPRGRLQVDGGYLEAPASRRASQADGRGFTSRIRRAYIGAQGTMPGGFGFRAEVDLAGNNVNWTDLYVSWDEGPFNITFGHHHPFTSLEQVSSDLFTTFLERASFITAFNYERRVGVSGGWKNDAFMVNAGVFTDDLDSLGNDSNKAYSFDGRAVWMPQFGDTQLHVGASAHYRDLNTTLTTNGSQYRARPYIGTTDIRYVDTGSLPVKRETGYGLELAAIHNRLHFTGEAAWLKANRVTGADPTFFGGYAEVGYFLTDDKRGYRNGVFDRTVPTDPLGGGGFGALEFNVRYDRLDLTDAGVTGGKQDGLGASLVWTPIPYVRFIAQYMHLEYDIPTQGPEFSAEVGGVRAQLDF
jgi:phosphate-selective porin OprO/OprP